MSEHAAAVWSQGRVESLTADGSLYHELRLSVPGVAQGLPGQFYMIAAGPGTPDPLLLRPLSLLSAGPEGLRFLFKVVGRGTSALAALTPGDTVRLLGPLGHGFTIASAPPPLLVGGGVGIPPLHFLSRVLDDQNIPHRVIFGFNSAGDIPDNLLAELTDQITICTMDGSRGFHGHPAALLAGEEGRPPCRIQACGPMLMLESLRGVARVQDELEISLEERMACGVGVCRGCVVPIKDETGWHYETVCRQGPVFDSATLHREGDDVRLEG